MITFINKDSTSSNVARSTPSERQLINEQSRGHRVSARTTSARTRARRQLHRSSHKNNNTLPPDHASGQATSENPNVIIDIDPSNTTDTTIKTYTVESLVSTTSLSPTRIPRSRTSSTSTSRSPTSRRSSTSTNTSTSTKSSDPRHDYLKVQPSISLSAIQNSITAHPIPLGHPIDPFGTTSTALTPTTLTLLHYYKQIFYTSIWTAVQQSLATYRHKHLCLSTNTAATTTTTKPATIPHCTPDKVIHDALRNSNSMSCLLANTGSHMSVSMSTTMSNNNTLNNFSSSSQNSPNQPLTPLHLLNTATTSLLHTLSSPHFTPTNSTLMSAMHLYLAAQRMHDKIAAREHLKGVRALVAGILNCGGRVEGPSLGVLLLIDEELAGGLLRGQLGVGERGMDGMDQVGMEGYGRSSGRVIEVV